MVFNRDFSKVSSDDLLEVVYACAVREYLYLDKDELAHLGRAQLRHRGWVATESIANKLKRKMDKEISEQLGKIVE